MPHSEDDGDRRPEGWSVPTRRALLGAAALVTVLLVALIGLGRIYQTGMGARTAIGIDEFPAPQLVTRLRDTGGETGSTTTPAEDARIRRAMRTIAGQGDAFWADGGIAP